jgi:hypothetical protein
MKTLLTLALVARLAPLTALAGPCGDELTQFEQKMKRESRKPSAGPTARQTEAAQLHRQPTPESVKEGEQRAQAAFDAVLVRARAADANGDQAACQKALGEAKDMFDPM